MPEGRLQTKTSPPRPTARLAAPWTPALDARIAKMLAEMVAVDPQQWSPIRPARVLICDWDGTAVVDRHQDAHPLAERIEELLRLGVFFIVVTGTNFGNVDRQVCRLIAPGPRRRLIVCANRGSEVYGFDRRGRAV